MPGPAPKRPRLEGAASDKPKGKDALLYERCLAEKGVGASFSARELENYGIGSGEDLITHCQALVAKQLFIPGSKAGLTVYTLRNRKDALQIMKLGQDPHMVYAQIENSGSTGIWKRYLVSRVNLHENTVSRCLKELMSKGLVKEIKSAKHPSKRIYMLSHLDPSDENTGGSFFSDGDLDTALIDALITCIIRYVQDESWTEQEGAAVVAKKRKRPTSEMAIRDAMESHEIYRTPTGKTGRPLIPRPPGYQGYPTSETITEMIAGLGILKDKALSVSDVTRVLTKLEYDGQLERMKMGKTIGYRTIRQVFDPRGDDAMFGPLEVSFDGVGPGNGLTQAPCGRCPVFDACLPGGEISPETCVYMAEWLDF